MIRSIGSSLLAKAGSGSLSRKKEETRITKPEIPGKGAVGTAGRDLVQATNITPTAPGSEKIIRSAPGVESASLPGVAGIAASQVPLVAGIGSPGGAPASAPAGAPTGVNQPTPQANGAPAPASAMGQAGRQAVLGASTGAPKGAVATARAAGIQPQKQGTQTQVQGGRIPIGEASMPEILNFGVRTSAHEENPTPVQTNMGWQPTALQYLAGKVGKIINEKRPTGNLSLGLANKAERFGGSQTVAATGQGSIQKSKIAQVISGGLRSLFNAAEKLNTKLRSKR